MHELLDTMALQAGNGELVRTVSGELMFKMHSCGKNPLITPQQLGLTWEHAGEKQTGSVFNGGAEIVDGKVMLMPRLHRDYQRKRLYLKKYAGIERYRLVDTYISVIHPLASENGLDFLPYGNAAILGDGTEHDDFTCGFEDVRIVKHKTRFYLVGTGKLKPPFKGDNADRTAVYTTDDFLSFAYHGMITSFDNRNAVPFFDASGVYMILRFNPNIHMVRLEGGEDQLLHISDYESVWKSIAEKKEHSFLMAAGTMPHESEKIGAGPQLIKIPEGWLFIYHAVGTIGNEITGEYGFNDGIRRGYSVCAAILDGNNPKKVLHRTRLPIYIPSHSYERNGDDQFPVDIPEVIFPTGAFVLKEKLFLYCGAGDKYTVQLSCSLPLLREYLKTQPSG